MARQSLHAELQFVNERGAPLSSGTLSIYISQSRTLATLYSDSGLTVPLDNPITLSSRGSCNIYVPYNTAYSYELLDENGKNYSIPGQLANIDFSVFDTSTTVDGGVRTITVTEAEISATNLTTATNTDMTINPGSGAYTVIGSQTLTLNSSNFNTNGYNLVSNSFNNHFQFYVSSDGAFNSSSDILSFATPGYAISSSYLTFSNAATGNAPSITFNSSAANRKVVIYSGYNPGNLIHISGVDYKAPSGTNTYLKSNGDGTTYWE